jgi:hypothetical protein
LGYGFTNEGIVFSSQQGQKLRSKFPEQVVSSQSPIHWVQGTPYSLVKRPGRETDGLLPSTAEVKNKQSYTYTPSYAFMAWGV